MNIFFLTGAIHSLRHIVLGHYVRQSERKGLVSAWLCEAVRKLKDEGLRLLGRVLFYWPQKPSFTRFAIAASAADGLAQPISSPGMLSCATKYGELKLHFPPSFATRALRRISYKCSGEI